MVLGRPARLNFQRNLFRNRPIHRPTFLPNEYGTLGAGIAFLLAQVLNIPVSMWNTKRLLHSNWESFAAALWRPAVSVSFMYVVVYWLELVLGDLGVWPRLLVESLAGAFVYAVCVLGARLAAGRPPGGGSVLSSAPQSFSCKAKLRAIRELSSSIES